MKLAIKKYLPFLLLAIILLLAFLLRSRMFLYGDFYFLPDQGRDMQLVKSIVVDHKFTLIGGRTGLGGLFHGPLWWYMIVPFFILAHGNPFFSLIPLYYVIGFGVIISGFFIGRRLYGDVAGLFIALLLSFSSEFINTIMFTSNSQVMSLVFIWYLFTILLFLRGKDKAIVFSLLLIGVGIHFESAFAILLLPLTLLAFLFKKHRPSIKYLIIGSILFFISISNFFLFDLRHQFLMTHSALNLLSGHVKPDAKNIAYTHILFRIQDRIAWFFSTFQSTLYTQTTLLIVLLVIVFIAGVLLLLKSFLQKKIQSNDKESIFLFLTVLVVYLLYVLYPLPLQEHYVQAITISAIFLLALILRKIMYSKIGIFLVAIFLLINIYPGLTWISQNYFSNQQYTSGRDGSYKNQLQVVQYVFQDAHGQPFGYFVYNPQILTYGMDYLMFWQGKYIYHYIPESQKMPVTYLIMYPPLAGDSHAHDFWKKNVIKTHGKVLSEKQFAGDIIVQKVAIDPKEDTVDPNYYQNLIFR